MEKAKNKTHKGRNALIIILSIIIALAIVMTVAGKHRSNPSDVKTYDVQNQYILDDTDISGHRSGGGIQPEETMRAFKNCAENPNFDIDVFEFDLHITKDKQLVLLHDDTLDRTSDSEEVFGEKKVRPENKTYEELRQLNMGAKFEDEDGNMPYAELKGEDVPDDLRILNLNDVLNYLIKVGNSHYKYIIEIKNGEELGKEGVDILYKMLEEKGITKNVVFGTFHKEVSAYVDEKYPKLARSTSIPEVLNFWLCALRNDKNYEPPCTVLQIPFCKPYTNLGINLATAQMINYAHSHGMAVQYWTVNDENDMKYLLDMDADCIMTDYPDKLYEVKSNSEK